MKSSSTLEDLYINVKDLNNAKAQLLLRTQNLDDVLARVHVRIAEVKDLNSHSHSHRLPSEILSHIFETGLSLPPSTSHSGKPFEIVTSQVSRRWRIVALQTPRLWTNLYIYISTSLVELLELYLERSGQGLLDITFETGTEDSGIEFDEYNFTRHLSSLIRHAARWRQLIVNAYLDISVLSPLVDIYAPALEKISLGQSIVHCHRHDVPPHSTCIDLFSHGTPILSSVSLYASYVYQVRFPLGSVKSLSLNNSHGVLSLQEAGELLTPMHFLTYLHVEGDMIYPSTHSHFIELPSVLTLHLSINGNQVSKMASLQYLDLPAIETLVIEGYDDIFHVPTHWRPTYPTLRSLKLTGRHFYDVAPELVVNFIIAFPTIEAVTFDDTDSITILEILGNRQSTEEPLWPKLRSMTIVRSWETSRFRVQPEYKFLTARILSCIARVIDRRLESGQPISLVGLSATIVEHAKPEDIFSSEGDISKHKIASIDRMYNVKGKQ